MASSTRPPAVFQTPSPPPLPAPPPSSSSSSSSMGAPHHVPPMQYKVLHVLRHGTCVHNEPNAHQLPPEALFDPSLTVQGVAQASAAKARVQALRPELVLTSPLTRCLQTATAVMASSPGGGEGKGARHVPIVALEMVREAYGVALPDKRRSTAELRAAFAPAVDLSALPDDDQLWTSSTRETLESVHGRARTLLQELLPRPERHILLVSHGVFLECLLQELLLADPLPNPDWPRQRQVMNAELYTVILVEVTESPPTTTPGTSPHLVSPPHGGGTAAFASAAGPSSRRLVRRLFLTPATHEMLAASELGGTGGFMEQVVCRAAQLFLAYSHVQYHMSLAHFTQLLGHCGVDEAFVCERYFTAMVSRKGASSSSSSSSTNHRVKEGLNFEDFLVGLVAMDPETANAGVWRRLRAEYIFLAYDLDDDGDLSFLDFTLMMEDMVRLKGGAVVPQAVEAEARKWHQGGRCSQDDFVSAVDTMQFQGTGVLFRTLRSPITCDAAHHQALLDSSLPPASPPPAPSSGGGGGSGASMRSAIRPGNNNNHHHHNHTITGSGCGRPPHGPPHHTPSASVVKVNSRQICFDVSKQRYSMSPHDKEPHRKLLQLERSGRRLRGNEGNAQGSGGKDTATAALANDLDASSGQGADEGLTPPMSAAQCTAQHIIRLLLDWDPNRPLGEPGVFGALVGGLRDLEPLFEELQALLAAEPTVLEVRTPARIFGDIHGQLGDLLRLFKAYGRPDRFGDINLVDYVFNGDFVDRGPCSCDVVLLLFSLKVAYPRHIFLIRGNHESRVVNANYGFKAECLRRLGNEAGGLLWEMCNSLFDHLPLAARVEQRILVLHGGLGATLTSLEQLQSLHRPIYDGHTAEEPLGQLLRDVLWSDPTASDTVTGLQDSPRGAGIALFGPDRVASFCQSNDLDVVVRSHQVVNNGYEFFANKRLITVFSATDYCGQHKNDGAILEIDRDLVITPKLVKDDKSSRWAMPRDSSPPRARLP